MSGTATEACLPNESVNTKCDGDPGAADDGDAEFSFARAATGGM